MKEEIEIPILNDEYKVICCFGDAKKVKKVLRSWGYKNGTVQQGDLDKRRGSCFYAENCHPIIAMPRFPKTPEEIGTLSHEAVHAISNIFEKIDSRYDDEIFAHSVGAIVRTVLSRKKSKLTI